MTNENLILKIFANRVFLMKYSTIKIKLCNVEKFQIGQAEQPSRTIISAYFTEQKTFPETFLTRLIITH